jgi:REP element-mobilizing transposase RayT
MKQERLKEGQFYHIYNRGNNRRDLFLEPVHYEHFLALYDKYVTPVAETLAWVLMGNHFHFVVRIKENVVYKYSKSDANSQSGFNADSPDSYRGEDAVRLPKKGPAADLTASARPVNVGRKEEKNDFQKYSNADRSRDAVRLPRKGPAADLTASARPVNVENTTKGDLSVPIVPIAIGIGRTPDNVEPKLMNRSWFEDHKWETIEMESYDGIGKPKKPVPHRHFAHLFNAYARYFNKRTDGTGNLFERPFKRKLVHNEDYLRQVILYVHNNPIHHGFCSHPLEYPWSSYITCVSEKLTKLKRESVLNLFNERDNFKKQHNQQINLEKIEKYLELDEVDYSIELTDSFNADSPDSYRGEDAVRLPNKTTKGDFVEYSNADRSIDAVRLQDKTTKGDLSACKAPDNVGNKRIGQKDADGVRFDQFNADSPDSYRGEDAVRLPNEATKGD